jgi:hypothetical protein
MFGDGAVGVDCSAIVFIAVANFSSSIAAWDTMPTTLRTSRSKVSTMSALWAMVGLIRRKERRSTCAPD